VGEKTEKAERLGLENVAVVSVFLYFRISGFS
jgi:hypothetical protein